MAIKEANISYKIYIIRESYILQVDVQKCYMEYLVSIVLYDYIVVMKVPQGHLN